MKSQIAGLRVASILFGLVFLGHLARVLFHVNVVIGTQLMPFWTSIVGLLVAGVLALWMWWLSRMVRR
jgi:hypothetical protein